MSVLKELNPHKGEVVRIKFKTINDIMATSKKDFEDTEDYYAFGFNIKAYLQGGDFIVANALNEDSCENGIAKSNYISIQNHLDHNYSFNVYDDVIESIEIVDDAERFVSHDHRILVVRAGDEMYINGNPLIWNDGSCLVSNIDDEEKVNPNRKLLKMFENFIADLAVKESFKDMNEGEE